MCVFVCDNLRGLKVKRCITKYNLKLIVHPLTEQRAAFRRLVVVGYNKKRLCTCDSDNKAISRKNGRSIEAVVCCV